MPSPSLYALVLLPLISLGLCLYYYVVNADDPPDCWPEFLKPSWGRGWTVGFADLDAVDQEMIARENKRLNPSGAWSGLASPPSKYAAAADDDDDDDPYLGGKTVRGRVQMTAISVVSPSSPSLCPPPSSPEGVG